MVSQQVDALTAWSGYVAPASVALPADILEPALAYVAVFCDQRVPDDAGDQIRLEHSVRGDAITIFERRPPWREDLGPEWTRQKIAQLRYDRASATWSLYWGDSNDRWLAYEPREPTGDVGPLLAEVGADPHGCFWG